jgi:hypothetical protein
VKCFLAEQASAECLAGASTTVTTSGIGCGPIMVGDGVASTFAAEAPPLRKLDNIMTARSPRDEGGIRSEVGGLTLVEPASRACVDSGRGRRSP